MPKSAKGKAQPGKGRPIGRVGEAFLEQLLLIEGFECFVPTLDSGVDILAYLRPDRPPLLVQSKARSVDQGFLWDIKIGQQTVLGPPTHYFLLHGAPPTDDYWLVPTNVIQRAWRRLRQRENIMRIILNEKVRKLFQPFKKEAGFRAARRWIAEQ